MTKQKNPRKMYMKYVLLIAIVFLYSCDKDEHSEPDSFILESVRVDDMDGSFIFSEISQNPVIKVNFSTRVDTNLIANRIKLHRNTRNYGLNFQYENDGKTIIIEAQNELLHITKYEDFLYLRVSELLSQEFFNQHLKKMIG